MVPFGHSFLKVLHLPLTRTLTGPHQEEHGPLGPQRPERAGVQSIPQEHHLRVAKQPNM